MDVSVAFAQMMERDYRIIHLDLLLR
jgi:hypothetical protein